MAIASAPQSPVGLDDTRRSDHALEMRRCGDYLRCVTIFAHFIDDRFAHDERVPRMFGVALTDGKLRLVIEPFEHTSPNTWEWKGTPLLGLPLYMSQGPSVVFGREDGELGPGDVHVLNGVWDMVPLRERHELVQKYGFYARTIGETGNGSAKNLPDGPHYLADNYIIREYYDSPRKDAGAFVPPVPVSETKK